MKLHISTDCGFRIELDKKGLHIASETGDCSTIATFEEWESLQSLLMHQYWAIKRPALEGMTTGREVPMKQP